MMVYSIEIKYYWWVIKIENLRKILYLMHVCVHLHVGMYSTIDNSVLFFDYNFYDCQITKIYHIQF